MNNNDEYAWNLMVQHDFFRNIPPALHPELREKFKEIKHTGESNCHSNILLNKHIITCMGRYLHQQKVDNIVHELIDESDTLFTFFF